MGERIDWYDIGATQADAMDEYGDDDGRALFKADDHQYGPGKTHLIRRNNAYSLNIDDSPHTRCGKALMGTAGSLLTGTEAHITCRGCLSGIESDRRHEEWLTEQEQRRIERADEAAAWWEWYNEYLNSPQWHERRKLVLKRANWICEGCGIHRAAHVHHLTYARAGNEMLFDLVAVCRDCHERIHNDAS